MLNLYKISSNTTTNGLSEPHKSLEKGATTSINIKTPHNKSEFTGVSDLG